MALTGVTVDWPTGLIEIPREAMTLVQLTPNEVRQLDLNEFRLALRDLEDSVEGMPFIKTHDHNTEVVLGGLTYARIVEILEPYTITFENGFYAVDLVGANSNVGDRVNLNNVSVRSNNSAGLISSADIEFSSFNGGVIINVNTGVPGTLFPTGTERQKSNNIADTILIAEFRGLRKIYADSDLTLSTTAQLDGYSIIGHSHVHSHLVIEDSANVTNSYFENLNMSGVLDGDNEIKGCILGDIHFFNGHIHDSGLRGTIYLDGNKPAHIGDGSQAEYDETPVIDMGGSGQDLVMTNYTGNVIIQNLGSQLTGSTEVGIGLNAGQVILDSTSVTGGTVFVSGIGSLVDENGTPILSGTWNGGVTIINRLINRNTITEATQLGDAIYINSGSTYTGTLFPVGSKRTPVNNLDDAVTIATNEGIDKLIFLSDYFFPDGTFIQDLELEGQGYLETTFTFQSLSGNCIVANCRFVHSTLTGDFSGVQSMTDCRLVDLGSIGIVPSSQELLLTRCFFDGITSIPSNYSGKITAVDCYSNVVGAATPTMNAGNSTSNVQFRNYTGGMKLTNLSQGNVLSIDLVSGQVKLDPATVTNATIVVRGSGKVINADTDEYIYTGVWNGGVNIRSEANTPIQSAKQVWDEPIAEHLDEGSTGRALGLGQFAGAVYVHALSGTTGTAYPKGTELDPVNNLADAVAISESNGSSKLVFLSDYTFSGGTYITNYDIYGQGFLDTTFTFDGLVTPVILFGCSVHDATVTGGFTGVRNFNDCRIDDLSGTGQQISTGEFAIEGSLFSSGGFTMTPLFQGKFSLFNCFSNVVGTSTPFIDFNGSSADLQIRNYTGGMKFYNIYSGNTISVDFISGQLKLDPATVTNGTIVVRGSGKVVNADTNEIIYSGLWNSGVTIVSEANTPIQTAKQVWDELIADHLIAGSTGRALGTIQFAGAVHIDPVNGVSGTTFPIGTERVSVNNLDDALTIAVREGLTTLELDNNLTLNPGDNISGYSVRTKSHSTLTVSPGAITFFSSFEDLNLEGTLNGYTIINNCSTSASGLSEFYGIMQNTVQNGPITLSSDNTKNAIIIDHIAGNVGSPPEINLNGDGAKLSLRGLTGAALITNKTGNTQKAFIDLYSGRIGFDSTVTAGEITVRGVGYIYLDDSTGTTFDTQGLMSKTTVSDAVWDVQLSGHTQSGSTGLALSGGTATEVWNYPLP